MSGDLFGDPQGVKPRVAAIWERECWAYEKSFSDAREDGGLQGGSDEESGLSLQSFDFWFDGFDLSIPLGSKEHSEYTCNGQSELASQASTFFFIDKQPVSLEL